MADVKFGVNSSHGEPLAKHDDVAVCANVKQCLRKVADGHVTAAIKVLCSSGVAPFGNDTLKALVAKHPNLPPPVMPASLLSESPLVVNEDCVLGCIKSFPKGTSCGRDGLRAQHILDAFCGEGSPIAVGLLKATTAMQGPTQYELVQPVSRLELLHHAWNSIITGDGERLMTKTNLAPDAEGRVNKSEIAYKQGPTQSEVVEVEEKNVVKSKNNSKIKVVEIDYKQGPTRSEVLEVETKNVVKSENNSKNKVVEIDYKQGPTQSEVVENDYKQGGEKTSKKIGVLSRIWKAVFGLRGDDFEKRLQYLRKEEGVIVNRMNMRSLRWRRTATNLIIFSVIIEVVAVGYAIVTTRTVDMDWRMRSLRVLPMFLIPALSFVLYYGLSSFTNFCDRRDQKTLDKLRDETRAKIDELKERSNYYITKQLIQKYDPGHAAHVLADELQPEAHIAGKSNDVDLQSQQTTGLTKRNQPHPRSPGSAETPQFVVENHNFAASGGQDGGWNARIAALLVGEDPTQSYALICGNCHMHNGLARKEEFPFTTYYCLHCNVLNKPKNLDKMSPVSGSQETASTDVKLTKENESTSEKVSAANSPVVAAVEEKEAKEITVAA
ncbi:uncharacterized protein LOC143634397 [Bidens hawaiensis]|uniref:uncharacterized protein LOC143634397 n=1 Tax=Bidens hawaiensis TaxID=980011 RepID=UPI0040490D5E